MRSPKSSAARRCASEATTMMRAGADCRSLPRSRFVSRKGARWFTAKVRLYPSALRAPGAPMTPALLISTSSRGRPDSSSCARRRTCASSAKSACTLRTLRLPVSRPSVRATARARSDQAFPPPADNEVSELRRYLSYGGFLLVDDASGTRGGAFEQSARQLVSRIVPGAQLGRVPRDHVLYKSFYLLEGPAGRVAAAPELEALDLGGRLAVLYSRTDLVGALARDS